MNWIDATKELPPNDTPCIVWVNEGSICGEGFFEVIFNCKEFRIEDNRFVKYENGGEYEIDFTESVTHWMIPVKPTK